MFGKNGDIAGRCAVVTDLSVCSTAGKVDVVAEHGRLTTRAAHGSIVRRPVDCDAAAVVPIHAGIRQRSEIRRLPVPACDQIDRAGAVVLDMRRNLEIARRQKRQGVRARIGQIIIDRGQF